jgi:glutathione S-transferase
MSNVELFSARVCPFAHRSRLVLLEKNIDFVLVEIDLQNKPSWFRSVSLHAKVPALRHGDVTLCESAVINEYLEEVFPSPPLLPADPAWRAQARLWIDFANTRFVPAFGKLLRAKSDHEQQEGRRELEDALDFIEREGFEKLGGAGPFWLGPKISLVDLTFYPWFERLPALTHYRGFEIPRALTRLRGWLDAVSQRPSVLTIANPPAFYVERYASYAGVQAPAQATAPEDRASS